MRGRLGGLLGELPSKPFNYCTSNTSSLVHDSECWAVDTGTGNADILVYNAVTQSDWISNESIKAKLMIRGEDDLVRSILKLNQ